MSTEPVDTPAEIDLQIARRGNDVLRAENARLTATLDRVRELHGETTPDPEFDSASPWCHADGKPWPCPTTQALDAG